MSAGNCTRRSRSTTLPSRGSTSRTARSSASWRFTGWNVVEYALFEPLLVEDARHQRDEVVAASEACSSTSVRRSGVMVSCLSRSSSIYPA